MDGIKVGGLNVNNIRYADDTAIVADSEGQLQNLIDAIAEESRRFRPRDQQKKDFLYDHFKEEYKSKVQNGN